MQNENRGPGLWKYNSALNNDATFVSKMEEHIDKIKTDMVNNQDKQFVWEFMKFEMRTCAMEYSKKLAKEKRQSKLLLENKLIHFEKLNIDISQNEEYIQTKIALEKIFEERIEGQRIRSKCSIYEMGEKSSKYFLNLEKKNAKLSSITTLQNGNGDLMTEKGEVENEILTFYKNLFKSKCKATAENCRQYLDNLNMKRLSETEAALCEKSLTLDELSESLDEMQLDKSPGNDGLTTEFYKQFWDGVKSPYYDSLIQAKLYGELSTSQRQAIIRLIEKKDKDKTKICNWRPISLLNIDLKIVSRALAKRLKTVLPSIINSNQTAYVLNRFIGEGSRVISDILEITETLSLEGYIATIDFEKAFDSLHHTFLTETLRIAGFQDYFINWIKVFLNKQESCVINDGTTTPYFSLERGARQGDPISAYLFIIALEALFMSVKKNANIRPIKIIDIEFLYTAYADDATFFLENEISLSYLIEELKMFSKYSGLMPNYSKCEFAGIGVKRGALRALCNFKTVDLTLYSIKILEIHFSYNITLRDERNFLITVKNI